MMNSIPRDWRIHGVFPQTTLMGGVLPRHGVHCLAGKSGDERDAAMADLAVAAASDATVCGLSAPDKNGARSSLSGFFGLPSGASTGVAIIAGGARADALFRAVQANALARGVSRPLPVAVVGGYSAEASGFRLHELSEWFASEYGVGLGLVILDGLSLPVGEVLAFQRPDRAVLVVGDAPSGVGDESVVVEFASGRMTVAKAACGEPWAREFALDVVSVGGVDALTVRPGKAVQPSPIWKAVAPVVVAPVAAPEPELPIVSRFALIISRGAITPAQRTKWTDDGYIIAASESAALPRQGEIIGGLREIIVTGEDQLPTELTARATRLREEAVRRGVDKAVTIRVAA